MWYRAWSSSGVEGAVSVNVWALVGGQICLRNCEYRTTPPVVQSNIDVGWQKCNRVVPGLMFCNRVWRAIRESFFLSISILCLSLTGYRYGQILMVPYPWSPRRGFAIREGMDVLVSTPLGNSGVLASQCTYWRRSAGLRTDLMMA